ncbi:hypothetical protein BDW02DRAFT_554457 [Decorospora gaudefroyi]|uniref:Ecp2 effector protein domain-containing protein n=1 Tax=Decorospora gaudefroyi TaxID=184978 RepID=A0A6A5K5V3_9PLEO|nr:hypothetical protein BDW02DRAFT_554457 [Decorospora gaudefroyi]
MKSTILAAAIALLTTPIPALAAVVFSLSTEPNGQGIRKSWLVDRWLCHDLASDLPSLDNNASWAFVAAGLANGCELYDNNNCTGKSLFVEKNNSNVLGPGPVNLTDYDFDNLASSFSCI